LNRGNKTANRILALLLFIFTLMIFFHASGQIQPQHMPEAGEENYGHTIFFLFGPLFFYYGKALTNREFRFWLHDIVHFTPFITVVILSFVDEQLPQAWQFSHVLEVILPWCMMVQMLAYLLGALCMLWNYVRRIRENYSSIEKINLHWLRLLMFAQVIIWPIAFFVEITKSNPHEMNIMWVLISVFMYMIGYFGIRQPEIFTGAIEEEAMEEGLAKKKYQKSTLTAEQSEAIIQKLFALMMETKPYLESNLTLPVLSKLLSVSTHHLSQVINEKFGQNFFDYINQFRVDEAKRLLRDPRHHHLNLAAIGFEVGFNSVSSFNTIFKKATSLTPSQYRSSSV
jgi:AraC-like DNA-binding protein